MQAAHKTATPGCARLLRDSLLDCSSLFHLRQRKLGMIRHRSFVACLAVILVFAGSSLAQRTAPHTTTIPSPKSVLGFTPGDDRTIAGWSQITDYFERLDRASDRVLVQTLGQSTWKRPLIVAFIVRVRIYWLSPNTKKSSNSSPIRARSL